MDYSNNQGLLLATSAVNPNKLAHFSNSQRPIYILAAAYPEVNPHTVRLFPFDIEVIRAAKPWYTTHMTMQSGDAQLSSWSPMSFFEGGADEGEVWEIEFIGKRSIYHRFYNTKLDTPFYSTYKKSGGKSIALVYFERNDFSMISVTAELDIVNAGTTNSF